MHINPYLYVNIDILKRSPIEQEGETVADYNILHTLFPL